MEEVSFCQGNCLYILTNNYRDFLLSGICRTRRIPVQWLYLLLHCRHMQQDATSPGTIAGFYHEVTVSIKESRACPAAMPVSYPLEDIVSGSCSTAKENQAGSHVILLILPQVPTVWIPRQMMQAMKMHNIQGEWGTSYQLCNNRQSARSANRSPMIWSQRTDSAMPAGTGIPSAKVTSSSCHSGILPTSSR